MAQRIYVGNLDARVTERELEDEFRRYGPVRNIWVARKPPGFAFIDFDDARDAEDAVRKLDGVKGWRVEISRKSDRDRGGPGRGPSRGSDRDRGMDRRGGSNPSREMRCYECGDVGHLARDCRAMGGKSRGGGSGGDRSASPRGDRDRGRSTSRDRDRSRSRSRDRARSISRDRD